VQRPPLVVVIDGPAGAGKSTAARKLAAALGLPLLDTGALYRSVAWAAHRRGVSWEDEEALAAVAKDLTVRFEATAADAPQRVWCDGVDVTIPIRTPAMSDGAARVSRHPQVRAALLGLQRAAAVGGCVAEGRDLGTVVFPDADVKVFLTASPEARARRRLFDTAVTGAAAAQSAVPAREGGAAATPVAPLVPRPSAEPAPAEPAPADPGPPPAAERDPESNEGSALEQVAAELRARDERDSTRAVAPLKQAPDAVLLDSSELDEAGVLARLLALVHAAEARRTQG
jgi:cytidylate kinase